jgi:hypothetical protein
LPPRSLPDAMFEVSLAWDDSSRALPENGARTGGSAKITLSEAIPYGYRPQTADHACF